MRFHVIFRYNGMILLINAAFMCISAVISFAKSDSAFFPLIYTALITALFGAFPLFFVPKTDEISNKEGFTIVVSSWMLSCLFGMIPYVLWGGEFTITNAWFESVSGFTTTGSTILGNIEALPMGLLFWRSATHWIGGVGIIIFALSVLPSMGKIGMILYRTETSPLAMANFRYRTRKTLHIIMMIYAGLTLLEIIALMLCGMNLFDAINHSFATIATGGFSPKNLSIAYYNSIAIEAVVMVFMLLSGINFGLLFLAISGQAGAIFKSTVVRYYILAMLVGIIAVAINLHGVVYEHWLDAFRYASFQLISIGTSTGFATTDSNLWPPFSKLLIIFFTLQCACSASTSGGIKVDRIVLFWYALWKRIKKMQHANVVVKVKVDNVAIEDDVIEASIVYILIYLFIVFVSTLVISGLGLDIMTAFSATAATMGNVGPGFGLVGSVSNFGHIPEMAKWILTGDMLLGRLEIFGLFLLFLMKTWK